MKFILPKGSTSVILIIFIRNSSSSVGAGLGSLAQGSSIVGGYVREGAVGLSLAVDENVNIEGTYEAPTTDNQIRIGTPANMRSGTYELHLHNDLCASGADYVSITLGGASNMAELQIEIQLTNIDLDTAISELAQGVPTATPTVKTALMLLYMALRNRLDVDTSGGTDYKEIYNNAGTVITKKALTDDGSVYSEAEMETGP